MTQIQSKQERDRARQRAAADKNKNDQRRKDDLVRALGKAKEKGELHRMYLIVNDRDLEDIATANLAIELIDNALEHLGALVPAES